MGGEDPNNTIDQSDLIDMNRTLHPTIIEYSFFSCSHQGVTKIDYMLSRKTNLNKFKRA